MSRAPTLVEQAEEHPSALRARRLSPMARLVGALLIVLLMMGGLFGIGAFGMSVLSGLRAFVGGEALWSKAQKDATAHLLRYSVVRQEGKYHEFKRLLEVPLGDKQARLELEKESPDFQVAHDGFKKGGNHPDDVEIMANLFRWFRRAEHVDRAITAWARGDELIARLESLGRTLHQLSSRGDPAAEEIDAVVALISRNNDELTKMEAAFSSALGDASRWASGLLTSVMTGFAAVAVVVCFSLLFFVGRIIRSLEATRRTLTTKSEDLARKSDELEQQNWLIAALNALNDRTRGEMTEEAFCRAVIDYLVSRLQAVVGVFFVLGDSGLLRPVGQHAVAPGRQAPATFQLGEGLVGQAAKENQRIVVSPAPEDYLKVQSGLGETHARHLAICPIAFEDSVVGVLELGSLEPFPDRALAFLEQAGRSIAIDLMMVTKVKRRDGAGDPH